MVSALDKARLVGRSNILVIFRCLEVFTHLNFSCKKYNALSISIICLFPHFTFQLFHSVWN